MASARRWSQRAADRADADLLRRTATWLREDPARAARAGLRCDEDTQALAALLDVLAGGLPDLAPGVRSEAVEACRQLLGEPSEESM